MALLTDNLIVDLSIISGTIIYFLYTYFTSRFGYWSKRGVPYIKPTPFLGNFKDVVLVKASIGQFLADLYKKTNHNFFGIWIFGTPHLIIKDPELVKNILVKDFHHFRDRTVASDEEADPVAAKLLFFLKNPEWKTMRSKLTPIFTTGKIKCMIPLMNDAAEEIKHYLSQELIKGKSIDAKEVCAKFTTDIVTSCAFGVHAESFRHENAEFREVGRKMFGYKISNAIRTTSYFLAPAVVKIFKMHFFDPTVNEFCREAFFETIKEREKSGTRRNDLIDMIIDMKKAGSFNGIKFEGDTVVAQAMQFFAAGFETTSSTIAFTLYEMCIHQELQTKLRTEIQLELKQHDGVTYEAIHSMKYLDRIVKETLRKYPVLPFLDRRCVKDYKIPNSDVVIERGTPVYIPMFGLHYDPRYFPEPEKYDPERFSEENVKKRPTCSYIPFGVGPHNCIGERFGLIASKLGIVQVLSNFHVDQTEDTPVPIDFDPRSFVLVSKVGLPMKFTGLNN